MFNNARISSDRPAWSAFALARLLLLSTNFIIYRHHIIFLLSQFWQCHYLCGEKSQKGKAPVSCFINCRKLDTCDVWSFRQIKLKLDWEVSLNRRTDGRTDRTAIALCITSLCGRATKYKWWYCVRGQAKFSVQNFIQYSVWTMSGLHK